MRIGVVETVVIFPPAQPAAVGSIQVGKKPHEKFRSHAGCFLPGADLLNTAGGRFWTSLKDYLLPESLHHSARAQPGEAVWLAQVQTNIKWRHTHEIHVAGLL
jgi:hypothetical protein